MNEFGYPVAQQVGINFGGDDSRYLYYKYLSKINIYNDKSISNTCARLYMSTTTSNDSTNLIACLLYTFFLGIYFKCSCDLLFFICRHGRLKRNIRAYTKSIIIYI